jgi:hypothetical protein
VSHISTERKGGGKWEERGEPERGGKEEGHEFPQHPGGLYKKKKRKQMTTVFFLLFLVNSLVSGEPKTKIECAELGNWVSDLCWIAPHEDDQTGQQVPDTNVWIGNEFAATNETWLKEASIGYIVSAIGEPSRGKIEGIQYLILDLIDNESQDMVDAIRKVHNWITPRSARHPEKGILVHCAAGVSRSSTLVIGHLLLSRPTLGVEDAIQLLKEVRSVIQPNRKFVQELHALVALRDARYKQRDL